MLRLDWLETGVDPDVVVGEVGVEQWWTLREYAILQDIVSIAYFVNVVFVVDF